MREPKRIIPKRSPFASVSPTCDQPTMRRAIAPVICLTTSVVRWIFKSPGHRFVLIRAGRIARIEAEAFVMFAVNDFPIDRRPVRVDIEDGEENADPSHLRFLRLRALRVRRYPRPHRPPPRPRARDPSGATRSGSRKKTKV